LYHNDTYVKHIKPAGSSIRDVGKPEGKWTVARVPDSRLTKLYVIFSGQKLQSGDAFGTKWLIKTNITATRSEDFLGKNNVAKVTSEEFKLALRKTKPEPRRYMRRCGAGEAEVAEAAGDTCCHGAVSNLARELHARVPKSITNYNQLTLELSKMVEKYAHMCMLEAITDSNIQEMMAEEFVGMIPELRDTFSDLSPCPTHFLTRKIVWKEFIRDP